MELLTYLIIDDTQMVYYKANQDKLTALFEM